MKNIPRRKQFTSSLDFKIAATHRDPHRNWEPLLQKALSQSLLRCQFLILSEGEDGKRLVRKRRGNLAASTLGS